MKKTIPTALLLFLITIFAGCSNTPVTVEYAKRTTNAYEPVCFKANRSGKLVFGQKSAVEIKKGSRITSEIHDLNEGETRTVPYTYYFLKRKYILFGKKEVRQFSNTITIERATQ